MWIIALEPDVCAGTGLEPSTNGVQGQVNKPVYQDIWWVMVLGIVCLFVLFPKIII